MGQPTSNTLKVTRGGFKNLWGNNEVFDLVLRFRCHPIITNQFIVPNRNTSVRKSISHVINQMQMRDRINQRLSGAIVIFLNFNEPFNGV